MEDGCEVWLGCDNSIEQFSGGGGTNIPASVNFLQDGQRGSKMVQECTRRYKKVKEFLRRSKKVQEGPKSLKNEQEGFGMFKKCKKVQ